MEAERTGGSSLGVYIVLVQLSVKTPGMLHMGSLLIIGVMHKNLCKNVDVGIVHKNRYKKVEVEVEVEV